MILEDFRYDHRYLYRAIVGFVAFVGGLFLFMALPNSTLMRVIGVTDLQKRISYLQNAVYWETRARLHVTDTQTPMVLYGSLVGVTKSGLIVISIPIGKKFEQRLVQVADVRLTDLLGVASQIGALRTEDARFDMYGRLAVIWVRGVPLNLNLIERGFAEPDPNPPTNIVDQVFATYYWRLFKGMKSQGDQ